MTLLLQPSDLKIYSQFQIFFNAKFKDIDHSLLRMLYLSTFETFHLFWFDCWVLIAELFTSHSMKCIERLD